MKQKLARFDDRLKEELAKVGLGPNAPMRPIGPEQPCPCGCGLTLRQVRETAPDIDEASSVHRRESGKERENG